MSGDDPQLDANVLIGIRNGVHDFLAYAQVNQGVGMSYSRVARMEFLASGLGTVADLQALQTSYGISYRMFRGCRISDAAARLQAAFAGDPLRRTLQVADARILATEFLTGERVATGDLQLFKRGRDLALPVDFVGSGRAAARASAYAPRPVSIPGEP
jgi:hypothetical protein